MYRSWENRIPARRHARSQIIPLWCVTTDNVTEVNFRLAEALIAGQLFLSYHRPCRTLWSVCKNARCHCFRKSCFERWMYLYVSRWPTCTGVIGIGQSLQRTTYQKMTRSQNLLVFSFSSVSGQRGCKFQQASIWIKTELNWCLVSFAWWGVQRKWNFMAFTPASHSMGRSIDDQLCFLLLFRKSELGISECAPISSCICSTIESNNRSMRTKLAVVRLAPLRLYRHRNYFNGLHWCIVFV